MAEHEAVTADAAQTPTQSIGEQTGSIALGLFVHFGPAALYVALLLLWGITPLTAILAYAGAAIFLPITFRIERTRPCVPLPGPSLGQILAGYSQVFLRGIAIGGAFIAAGWYLLSLISPWPTLSTAWPTIIIAVLLTDLGYYATHRWLCHGEGKHPVVQFYRRAHADHHRIEQLDFLRGNQGSLIDTAFSQFQPCVIVISFLLGMSLEATLAAYSIVLLLQTTDHANHTFHIGPLRYLFADNHGHKLHHCLGGGAVNFGAAFSLYDRLFGTWLENPELNGSYMHRHRIALPGGATHSPALTPSGTL